MSSARMEVTEDSGFALLVVLWACVLLSLLITSVVLTGRTEARIAANLRTNAELAAEADGLVNDAIFHVAEATDQHWDPGGLPHMVRLPRGVGTVEVRNLNGRIGLNVASSTLIGALLRHLGVDPQRSASLAAAIVDWRSSNLQALPHGAKAAQYQQAGRAFGPPGAPFRSVDELALVLGITPDLLARITPHVSAFLEDDPDLSQADPIVAAAVADASGRNILPNAMPDPGKPQLISITVTMRDGHGASVVRQATVRINTAGLGAPGPFYSILAWGQSE